MGSSEEEHRLAKQLQDSANAYLQDTDELIDFAQMGHLDEARRLGRSDGMRRHAPAR